MTTDKSLLEEEGRRSYQALVGAVLGAFAVLLAPAMLGLRLPLAAYLAAEVGVAVAAALYTSRRTRARLVYAIAFVAVTIGVGYGDTWFAAQVSRTLGAVLAFSFAAALPGVLLMIVLRPLTRYD